MAYIQVSVAVSMILAAATATTPNPSDSKTPPAKAANADNAVKYCIEEEAFTGSRTTKTQCLTKEQWAREGVDVDQLIKH